jgi:hypothetical protein
MTGRVVLLGMTGRVVLLGMTGRVALLVVAIERIPFLLTF